MIDSRELADPEFFSRLESDELRARGGRGLPMRNLCALCCVTVGLAVAAAADDDRARDEAAEADRLCVEELPHWRITADGTPLTPPKEPVLRWTNPFAGRVYGNTYLWLQGGRPAAASSMHRYFTPYQSFDGEVVALTGTKLVAKRDEEVMWHPRDEWKWHSLDGAPTPAPTAPQRLIQMGAIAKDFTVELLDTRNVLKGENQTPRLLPRPLYRYNAEQTRALDGAVYAFVLGTDPELLLLLECDTAAATPVWRFGVGRMNCDLIHLKHKGKTVWEVAATTANSPEEVYMYLRFAKPKKEPKP
jgi:hypothetical protein